MLMLTRSTQSGKTSCSQGIDVLANSGQPGGTRCPQRLRRDLICRRSDRRCRWVRHFYRVSQEPVAPSAAVIAWMASVSAGLTLCPCSLCAAATLFARARMKRR
jgi:hypothetical protein